MRLFQRVTDIITANLNDLVDRFEQPEVMLRQAIREMEVSLERASSAAARAIASERLLAREFADHERKARQWQAHAEAALTAHDEALARRALSRRLEHDQLARALSNQRDSASETSLTLGRQVNAMRAKLAEARRKLASLTARHTAAVARKQFRASLPGPSANGLVRFEQMQARVEQEEAEATALNDLFEDAGDLEARLTASQDAEAIEAELEALRHKIRAQTAEPKP